MASMLRKCIPIVFVGIGPLALVSVAAFAADIVINNAVTTTQTVDGDDTLSVTETGSITTTGGGVDAIFVTGNNNVITNAGSITTAGDDASGIAFGSGSGCGLGGPGCSGLSSSSDDNSVINSGTIATAGSAAYGISVTGDRNTIVNSGKVATTGGDGIGILVNGSDNKITHSGLIQTSNYLAYGIQTDGSNNAIANTGGIGTVGDTAHGILTWGYDNIVINRGIIATAGADAIGVWLGGDGDTLFNSGKIVSARADSIAFYNPNATLNLLAPSFLGGRINLGEDPEAPVTVNITSGRSHSILWDLSTGNMTGGAPNLSGPMPIFYNSGTQKVATFDPTGLAASTDTLADYTGGIASLVQSRLDGVGNSWWASGFGGGASYKATATTFERDHRQYGFAIGYDRKLSPDLTVGALAGYGWTGLDANARYGKAVDNKAEGGFLGLYGQKTWQPLFLNLALTGGWLDHSDWRFVNDNLAPLGESSARASYTSWWLSPQASLGANLGLGEGWSAIPAAHLRYAWQSVDAYTETGASAGNARLAGRSVEMFESRLELGLRKQLGSATFDLRGGWLYRAALGDDKARLTMIGVTGDVPTHAKDRNAGYVGAGLGIGLSNAITFKLRGEAILGNGMTSYGGLAQLSAHF